MRQKRKKKERKKEQTKRTNKQKESDSVNARYTLFTYARISHSELKTKINKKLWERIFECRCSLRVFFLCVLVVQKRCIF